MPLQSALATAWPVATMGAPGATQAMPPASADAAGDAHANCHGRVVADAADGSAADAAVAQGEAGAATHASDIDGDGPCSCCAACGGAALPATAPLIAGGDGRDTTPGALSATALAFVTEGPERPPRS